MKIEVLLAIMFFENEPADFLNNMNIETDIVIGNQCKRNETELFTHNGHNVKVVSRNERGVGKKQKYDSFQF